MRSLIAIALIATTSPAWAAPPDLEGTYQLETSPDSRLVTLVVQAETCGEYRVTRTVGPRTLIGRGRRGSKPSELRVVYSIGLLGGLQKSEAPRSVYRLDSDGSLRGRTWLSTGGRWVRAVERGKRLTLPPWSLRRRVHRLPAGLHEASGIATSRLDPSVTYHVNDGSAPVVVRVRDQEPDTAERVRIRGAYSLLPSPKGDRVSVLDDLEDIATGPGPDGRPCLFLGFIGNNNRMRRSIKIAVVDEETLRLRHVVNARYDDGVAHDAEAMAVHPNGDLFIITKELPAKVFRLPKARLARNRGFLRSHRLERVGTIDLRAVTGPTRKNRGATVTACDISPDGRRLVLGTYEGAVELGIDLSAHPGGRLPLVDIRRIPLQDLPQVEAIAYSRRGASIIYTSEVRGGAEDRLLTRFAFEQVHLRSTRRRTWSRRSHDPR